MPYVIVTAQVEDAARWEQGFRTHADLFRKQTINEPIKFAHSGENEVTCLFRPDDIDTYMRILDSSETAEAMDFDGIKRDTVKAIVLDETFDLS